MKDYQALEILSLFLRHSDSVAHDDLDDAIKTSMETLKERIDNNHPTFAHHLRLWLERRMP